MKTEKTPFHISKKYKSYRVPEFKQYGKYQNDLFFARSGKDSVDYLNKLKEICNEKANS